MSNPIRLLALTGVALAVLTGFADAKDAKDIVVAVIPKVAVPFFDNCNATKAAAEKAGVQYQWVVPQNTQGSTQVKIVEDLISKKVDGIAISVNEPKSVENVIKQAVAAGIKVVTFDSDSAKSGRSLYIGTINAAAGETMGKSMGEGAWRQGRGRHRDRPAWRVQSERTHRGHQDGARQIPRHQGRRHRGHGRRSREGRVGRRGAVPLGHPNLKGIFGVSQVGGPSVRQGDGGRRSSPTGRAL